MLQYLKWAGGHPAVSECEVSTGPVKELQLGAIKRWGPISTVVVLGLLAIFSMLGCGEVPTSPREENGIGDWTAAAAGKDKTVPKINKGDSVSTSKVVGPTGDSVSVTIGGQNRKTGLFVPPGALNGRAQIAMTVRRVHSASGVEYVYEFGPDGLQFRFKSVLFLDVARPDGTPLALSWFNPNTNRWEIHGKAVVQNGRASFPFIKHFSKYGISCRGNGT